MDQKPLYINGKPMPFTAEELLKILRIIKKSILKAGEEITKEEEKNILDNLMNELNNA